MKIPNLTKSQIDKYIKTKNHKKLNQIIHFNSEYENVIFSLAKKIVCLPNGNYLIDRMIQKKRFQFPFLFYAVRYQKWILVKKILPFYQLSNCDRNELIISFFKCEIKTFTGLKRLLNLIDFSTTGDNLLYLFQTFLMIEINKQYTENSLYQHHLDIAKFILSLAKTEKERKNIVIKSAKLIGQTNSKLFIRYFITFHRISIKEVVKGLVFAVGTENILYVQKIFMDYLMSLALKPCFSNEKHLTKKRKFSGILLKNILFGLKEFEKTAGVRIPNRKNVSEEFITLLNSKFWTLVACYFVYNHFKIISIKTYKLDTLGLDFNEFKEFNITGPLIFFDQTAELDYIDVSLSFVRSLKNYSAPFHLDYFLGLYSFISKRICFSSPFLNETLFLIQVNCSDVLCHSGEMCGHFGGTFRDITSCCLEKFILQQIEN